MTIVAGGDLATTSGFAVLDGDRFVHAEAFRPDGADDATIFHNFRAWLTHRLRLYRVEHFAIEEPLRTDLSRPDDREHHIGGKRPIVNMRTYLRLYGFRAHAIEVCHSLGVPCAEVNQSSWRKAFIGNGRASKDDAVAQCRLLRWPIESKDACEAAGVAWWLSGHLRGARLARPGELFAESVA